MSNKAEKYKTICCVLIPVVYFMVEVEKFLPLGRLLPLPWQTSPLHTERKGAEEEERKKD